ncbi:hypothetical protein VPNG_07296 [Cytospora leucostoma]|uniref:Uncharacterized protein n=1 Tax=Cytospora leucostoma TaxID=1230097 RepID=A0A423WKH8_9PEZI|nr:hypothetical protein VPNG_07296 [Cytospora leucostoma]
MAHRNIPYPGLYYLPRLLSHSPIPSKCLPPRSCLIIQSSSVGYGGSKRFHSNDTAIAASVTAVDGHGSADLAPRGFHARRIRARELLVPESDYLEPALQEVKPDKMLPISPATRSRSSTRPVTTKRDRKRRRQRALDWLEPIEKHAELRREACVHMGDEIGVLWQDLTTMGISHFRVLLAAQRAAANVEKAKRAVDTAAADKVRKLEVKASHLASLEAKHRKAVEDARAIVMAQVEAHPRYAHDPGKMLRAKLQELDRLVWFKSLFHYNFPPVFHKGLSHTLLQGYYRTMDDDGFPLIILFPHNAPDCITGDTRFEQEVKIMRSFAACWRKGQKVIKSGICLSWLALGSADHTHVQKSRYNQAPFPDVQSISIMICEVSIASEQTWKEGILYRGFHIGTKNDELAGDYGWWTHGRVIDRKWLDTSQVIRIPFAELGIPYRRDLLRSTLRNVHDPEKPIFLEEIRNKRRDALLDLKRWRIKVWKRAIAKYGVGKVSHYLRREGAPRSELLGACFITGIDHGVVDSGTIEGKNSRSTSYADLDTQRRRA